MAIITSSPMTVSPDVKAQVEAALASDPNNPSALHLMGVIVAEEGNLKRGIELIEQSLRKAPTSEAYNDLGQLWTKLEVLDLAETCFVKSYTMDEKNGFAANNVGRCLELKGETLDALSWYARAHEAAPKEPLFTFNFAQVLIRDNKQEAAVGLILSCGPDALEDPTLSFTYATALEQLGQFEKAAENYRRCIDKAPDNADAWASLIALPDATNADDLEQAMRLANTSASEGENFVRLSYALGKAWDAQGDYKQAAKWFKRANDAQGAQSAFDINVARQSFAAMKDVLGSGRIKELQAFGHDDERPVLIVGLPRTGTSLTEQIIASHPQAFGAGELQILQRGVTQLFAPLQNTAAFEASIRADDVGQKVSEIARVYRGELSRLAPDGAARIVDKFPHNFMHLGLFAAAFPKAHIIHCVRDARDVALSCYMNAFRMGFDYTNDFKDFFAFEALQNDFMAHWYEALPNPPLKVVYEDLVHDTEAQVRRIIDHIDLPWDDACLNFSETKRGVRTPSYWQVRQKIYSKSIGRWKNYENLISPAFEAASSAP